MTAPFDTASGLLEGSAVSSMEYVAGIGVHGLLDSACCFFRRVILGATIRFRARLDAISAQSSLLREAQRRHLTHLMANSLPDTCSLM